MREELKGRALSFTEIAKLVGENWQNLSAAEKEPFDSQAQVMKERYLADLAEYKKAPEYRKYQAYLQEFKAKHACPSQGVYSCVAQPAVLPECDLTRRGDLQKRTLRNGSGCPSLGPRVVPALPRPLAGRVGEKAAQAAAGEASHPLAGRGLALP